MFEDHPEFSNIGRNPNAIEGGWVGIVFAGAFVGACIGAVLIAVDLWAVIKALA
jgi:hypothetical protein